MSFSNGKGPGDPGFVIESVWVFIAFDEKENAEGVIGKTIGGAFMPFVAADERRIELLRPHAQEIAELSGKSIKLVHFSTRKEVETIHPKTVRRPATPPDTFRSEGRM